MRAFSCSSRPCKPERGCELQRVRSAAVAIPASMDAGWAEPSDEEALAALLPALGASSEDVRLDAASGIAEAVAGAYGADGAALGAALRELGGIAQLAVMLTEPSDAIKAQVLLALGNLCSNSVDENSYLTKEALLQLGVASALLACALSSDVDVRMLSCATLQNVCDQPEWAAAVVSLGAVPVFETYVATPDEVRAFARFQTPPLAARSNAADVGPASTIDARVRTRDGRRTRWWCTTAPACCAT